MWTPATRKNYSRNGLRNQSDVTDEEWRVIEPYLPPAKGMGPPRFCSFPMCATQLVQG